MCRKSTRILCISQYGSGSIYGCVLANDIAIVLDRAPYKGVGPGYDSCLGRKDTVYGCALNLAYVGISKKENVDRGEGTNEYRQYLNTLASKYGVTENLYEAPEDKVMEAIDYCMEKGGGNRFISVPADIEES